MTETIARAAQTRQVCELDGCENSVPVTDGQPRRYCCAAHRRTARAQHRAEFEAEASADAQAVRDTSTRPQAPQPEAAPRGTLVTTTRSRWSRRTVQASVPAITPSGPPPSPPPSPLPEPAIPSPLPEPAAAPEPVPAALAPEPAPLPEPVAASLPEPAPLPEPVAASLPEPAPAAVSSPEPALAPAAPKPATRSVDLRPSTATPIVRLPLGAFAVGMAEALSAALHSLASNRMRSVLTTIGIIVGVGSVIVLVAMGDGMTKAFNDQWSPFATQIYIKPITGPVATGKAPQHLTDADLKALQAKDATPDVVQWSRAVASNSVTLAVDQKKAGAALDGVEQNYLDLANRRITAGSWFTPKQMEATARQAVIGPEVLNQLWGPGTDPNSVIGVPMRVGHSTFIVQGVINSDGQDDNVVLVPLSAARAYVVGDNAGKLDIIIAKSSSTATIDQAMSEIYSVLFKQHKVREATDRDFNVTDNTNILNQSMSSIRFLSIFILAVAAISLFVGGVGVANIMLVAVTERTREIGIRKAIGAPRRAIMRQFLSEAVMLTALGGLIGSALGITLCMVGHAVIPKLWPPDPASMTPTPIPLLTATPVAVAFGVSVVIGLLAGGYPAYRASRLRPIEALRFE